MSMLKALIKSTVFTKIPVRTEKSFTEAFLCYTLSSENGI